MSEQDAPPDGQAAGGSSSSEVDALDDRDLRIISGRLGSEWQRLAVYLGLSVAEIDQIMMDHPRQTRNQILQMLVKWRNQQSTGMYQMREVLSTALMEIDRTDICVLLIALDDRDLRIISERLGSEWQRLAVHLGLSAVEIDHIKMDDQGQRENQIFNMLVKWRNHQSTGMHQMREVLSTALLEIDRGDIVRYLIGVPSEIRNRAVYQKALEKGSETVHRTRLMIVGQERVGKTSLMRSLVHERSVVN